MGKEAKYHLYCTKCGAEIENFGVWFSQGQKCTCGCARAEVKYFTDYSLLKRLCSTPVEAYSSQTAQGSKPLEACPSQTAQGSKPVAACPSQMVHSSGGEENGSAQSGTLKDSPETGLFRYFDFLPLNDRKDIISLGEGTVPLERWQFLEDWAKEKFGIDCKVVVTRSDLSGGTGTFKDPAGALAASLFKEYGVKDFCVASTGNTATAFSRYLSLVGTKCTVFSPSDVNPDTVEDVRSYGQTMNVSEGNYACAKKECAEFSAAHGVLTSAGNIDPIRVESKRTLVFEYMRQLGGMPDVYIQAVAGGTAPIALDKGVREVNDPQVKAAFDCAQLCGGKEVRLPRMVLVQQDLCDPMVQAWEKAVASGFPQGWESDYPSIAHPATKISILSTGTPGMYPIVAPIVRKSGGCFVRVREDSLVELAKEVYAHKGLVPGPASMVCIAGFIQALEQGLVHSGETVSVNMGEGSGRASAFRNKVLVASVNGNNDRQ